MSRFSFLVLLVMSSQYALATGVDKIQVNISLNLKRCDDVLVDGKLQNCVDNPPAAKDLVFDLSKSCKQLEEVVNCSSSQMLTARMDNGSATAIIVVSKKDKAGEAQILANIMLIPGTNFSQQSVLNLTLPESGVLPLTMRLQSTSYKAQGDDRLYIPSLVIK